MSWGTHRAASPALWIGGARINPDLFLAFQRRFINNPQIPEAIRKELPLDAAPALNVADHRVKAVMAMAPGIIQAFGMDAAGLGELKVPAFLTVGASDTQTPPKENAVFAAGHIPHSQLWVIPGRSTMRSSPTSATRKAGTSSPRAASISQVSIGTSCTGRSPLAR